MLAFHKHLLKALEILSFALRDVDYPTCQQVVYTAVVQHGFCNR